MWILIALAALLLLSAALAWLLFTMACDRNGGPLAIILKKLLKSDGSPLDSFRHIIDGAKQWYARQPWQEVFITAKDGIRLRAVYLPHPQAKRAILCVHGYHGSGLRDFSGALEEFYRQNCSILLIDQRAHGLSGGKYTTFGALERYDVCLWAHELVGLTDGKLPIYLDGVSMGAATVLMAGKMQMPRHIAGVIADCGYTTPKEQLTHVAKNMLRLPAFPAVWLILLAAKLFGRFSLDVSATKGAAAWNAPLLLAHGLDDTFVPCRMSEANFAACKGEKQLLLAPGAEHGLSYMFEKERYLQLIDQLFARGDANFHKKAENR